MITHSRQAHAFRLLDNGVVLGGQTGSSVTPARPQRRNRGEGGGEDEGKRGEREWKREAGEREGERGKGKRVRGRGGEGKREAGEREGRRARGEKRNG